jgi:hypothetical protein
MSFYTAKFCYDVSEQPDINKNPTYLKAMSSMRKPSTHHAAVTNGLRNVRFYRDTAYAGCSSLVAGFSGDTWSNWAKFEIVSK